MKVFPEVYRALDIGTIFQKLLRGIVVVPEPFPCHLLVEGTEFFLFAINVKDSLEDGLSVRVNPDN